MCWVDPPQKVSRGQAVARLPVGASVRVVLLAGFECFRVHWVAGRSVPCDGENCDMCKTHVPARIRGYAPALVQSRVAWDPFVLEVPEGCLVGDPLPLRQVLLFRRHRAGSRWRMNVESVGVALPSLPAAWPVRPAVEAMFARFAAGVKRSASS